MTKLTKAELDAIEANVREARKYEMVNTDTYCADADALLALKDEMAGDLSDVLDELDQAGIGTYYPGVKKARALLERIGRE